MADKGQERTREGQIDRVMLVCGEQSRSRRLACDCLGPHAMQEIVIPCSIQ